MPPKFLVNKTVYFGFPKYPFIWAFARGGLKASPSTRCLPFALMALLKIPCMSLRDAVAISVTHQVNSCTESFQLYTLPKHFKNWEKPMI